MAFGEAFGGSTAFEAQQDLYRKQGGADKGTRQGDMSDMVESGRNGSRDGQTAVRSHADAARDNARTEWQSAVEAHRNALAENEKVKTGDGQGEGSRMAVTQAELFRNQAGIDKKNAELYIDGALKLTA